MTISTPSAIVRSVLSSVILMTSIACGSDRTLTAPSSLNAANSRPTATLPSSAFMRGTSPTPHFATSPARRLKS